MPYPSFSFPFLIHTHRSLSVIQNLDLQPGPDGQIVHGNLMFSLATEGQDTSRSGSQQLQQLDLAYSFNDMCVSSSSTGAGNTLPSRSRSSQLPSSPYNRDGNLAPASHHHLRPSHSFSTLPIRHSPPPPSPASVVHLYRNPSPSHITPRNHNISNPLPRSQQQQQHLLWRQLHSLRRSKRDCRWDGNSNTIRADTHTMSTTYTPDHLDPSST